MPLALIASLACSRNASAQQPDPAHPNYDAVTVKVNDSLSRATSNPPNSTATKPLMMARDADPDWEVATVKPHNSGEKKDRMDVEGRHVIIENETVETILMTGFNVQKSQIAGLPDWTRTEHWDADGVPNVEGRPDIQQWQSMLRKLLQERFGLKLHHEEREMSVFALKTARGGPKLKETARPDDGHPIRDARRFNGVLTNTFTNTSMSDLASMLLLSVDRPIVDRTALKRRYDFKLQWTVDDAEISENASPGLFTALQEQLGLKLEPVKAVADVLVIDKVERPGAN